MNLTYKAIFAASIQLWQNEVNGGRKNRRKKENHNKKFMFLNKSAKHKFGT